MMIPNAYHPITMDIHDYVTSSRYPAGGPVVRAHIDTLLDWTKTQNTHTTNTTSHPHKYYITK